MRFPRSAGVLLHITSLPGPYDTGVLGQEARQFVDALQRARVRMPTVTKRFDGDTMAVARLNKITSAFFRGCAIHKEMGVVLRQLGANDV